MREDPARTNSTAWRNAPLVAALIAAVAHVLLHLEGTAITEDGWAYWQGAVSLAEQGTYTYFSGEPILAWPPLYSLYLAAWTLVLGPSALTLVAANGLLAVAQAWLWTRLAQELARASTFEARPAAALTAAVFIALFVALNGRWVLAHNLLYALLPLQILATWRLSQDVIVVPVRTAGVLWLTATAGLLTHNTAAVFLVASAATVSLLTRGPLLGRAASATLLTVPPVAIWACVRWGLGQTDSHAVGAARESWLAYVVQAVSGIGELIAPKTLAPAAAVLLVALVVLLLTRTAPVLARFLAVFAGVAVAALLALFSLVWVNDPLSGRFVAFVPLLVVPALMLTASHTHLLVLPAVAAAVIPLQAWRVAKWSFDNPHLETPSVFVPIAAEISRTAVPGTTAIDGGRLLIGPSPWQERRGRTD